MRSRALAATAAVLVLTLAAAPPAKREPYRLALPGYVYQFPRDHFNHPDFRTEWWYYTGNVHTRDGRRFGYELTFFRQGVSREKATSVWDVQDVWMAHLALSDITGRRFFHTERFNRSGPGLAGADLTQARVWNGNWEAGWMLDPQRHAEPAIKGAAGGAHTAITGRVQTLHAVADRFSFILDLRSEKPPVIHGRDGVSQKAEGPGKASHYISLTRLITQGTISLDGQTFTVEGASWMDHEFGQSGWDWFSLQFDNGSELMLFRLRRGDGSIDPYSAGTYVDPQGRSRTLAVREFMLTPGRIWTSPTTGGRYPVEWGLRVPSLGIDASVRTPLDTQELTSASRSGTNYWEGAIDITGSDHGKPLRGSGYLEMTGYAGRVLGLN
jgi:predicted secreted hydrolase